MLTGPLAKEKYYLGIQEYFQQRIENIVRMEILHVVCVSSYGFFLLILGP